MKLSDIVAFIEDPEQFTLYHNGSALAYLHEAGAPSDRSRFYLAGFEFGAEHLVHVESYHGDGLGDAWEAWIDALPTIPEEELIEAYSPGRGQGSFLDEAIDAYPGRGEGRWTDEDWAKIRANAKAALDAAAQNAQDGVGDYPELVEGYEMQSNCSGTGIVNVGHYAWMREAGLDEIEVLPREESETDAA